MSKKICNKAAELSGLDSSTLERCLDIARKSSEIGADVLKKHFGAIESIKSKGRIGDIVTSADIDAENQIIKYLSEATPEYSILAEESGPLNHASSLTWCIDPLDGTTNYAHGYPFFGTSVGLIINNQPILGAISVPYLNEFYFAAPGIGSFCNGSKITVSSTSSISDSLLVTGFAYDRHTRLDNNYAEFCWLTHRTRGVRRGGAAAIDLAFVASGKVDAYWERGLAPWDIAAGIPIVELAGGNVRDYRKEEFNLTNGRVLASTPGLDELLLTELDKVEPLDGNCFGAPNLDANSN